MFGDDPDPTVTTVRVGSGTALYARARRAAGTMQRGVRRTRSSVWTEKREGKSNPTTASGDQKRPTLDRL